MTTQELKGKNILILGYGKEGKATEAYLKAKAAPAHIAIADQKDGPDYLLQQTGYDLIIKTPGINKQLITVPYTTATNIFFANCKNTIIGVTGTKGKSTTASLINHILRASGFKSHLVGNIGNPALTQLLEPAAADEIFVMELSSYMLDDIKYSPHISVILNLFPEHMNYHGSIQNYYEAKKRIVNHAHPDDYFIYSDSYPELQSLAETLKCRTIPYNDLVLPEGTVKIQGNHNRDNLRAALTVVQLMGVSVNSGFTAAQSFMPLPHRLEHVGTYKNIQFYDDAISTTPESAAAAIETLKAVGTIMLGGQDRGYDYRRLVNLITEKRIPNIVLFPEAGMAIRRLIEESGEYQPHMFETKDMEEAVKFSYNHTPEGTVCLLSTAAPSYSIWKNFEEKGDLFKYFVSKYAEKPTD